MLHKLTAALTFALLSLMPRAVAEPAHGIALYGAPKEPPGFTHFSYVNPDAPKGGRLVIGAFGSFDSLNPLIIKGVAANGIARFDHREPDGARARRAVHALWPHRRDGRDARGSLVDHLQSQSARRTSPTASRSPPTTCIFSLQLLKEKGRPNHRTYYAKVAKAERLSDHAVRFTFDAAGDREIPLIIGLMPVLPKHAINPDTFENTSLQFPVRLRPLPGRQGRRRPLHYLRARRELLGPRSAGKPRPFQLRRNPLRLLPRRRR